MAETEVVRITAELVRAAREEGASLSRSTAQQLSHWARLGRALESSSISASGIRAVLEGRRSIDELAAEDEKAIAEVWSTRIDETIRSLDLAERFRATGEQYAELDDDGNVVVRGEQVGLGDFTPELRVAAATTTAKARREKAERTARSDA